MKKEKRLTIHGDTRIDPYFWMGERDNPEVLAHLKAENAYAKSQLEPSAQLKKEIFAEMVSRIQKKDAGVPIQIDDYYYYYRYDENSEYPILGRKKLSLSAKEEVILDANIVAKGTRFFSLGGWDTSPDHKWLAYSTDTVGRRIYTIYIKNLERRRKKILSCHNPSQAGQA